MKTANLLKSALFASAIAAVTLTGCESKNDPAPEAKNPENPETGGTRYITLAATKSSGSNGAAPTAPNGNGGIFVYGITHEQAIDPSFELDIHGKDAGFHITSPRTSRIQVSEDGTKLWDIQYTGPDGGVFSSYSVHGKNDYRPFGRQVNTGDALGTTTPRWTKSTDDIGFVLRSAETVTESEGTGLDATFKRKVTTFKIAELDLVNPGMANMRTMPVAFPDEWASKGYVLGRTDMPLLNKAKNKVYIACSVSKIDPNEPSLDTDGRVQWVKNDNANSTIGAVTLVLDYPSLRNPELTISNVAKGDNNSFRTQIQHIATDGHVYQAVCSHGVGHKITRISSATNKYDDSYDFDLRTALGLNDMNIVGFKYIKDGIGVVLYNREKSDGKKYGAHLALVDLNAKTATKLPTELEADEAFYQNNVLNQWQNIGAIGDYAYVPLAPPSKDGYLYVINWKTKEITKGAKLKNMAFAYYIGAY